MNSAGLPAALPPAAGAGGGGTPDVIPGVIPSVIPDVTPDVTTDATQDPWPLAHTAIGLLAATPHGLGGILLRAGPGPVRDAFTAALAAALPPGTPLRRLPASADVEALDGGLDLTATLAAGRPVARPGLLAEVGAGFLLVPMAERLAPALAARLAAALDDNGPRLLLFDEREPGSDDSISPALADRLAIHLDLAPARLALAALLNHDPHAPAAPPRSDPGEPVADPASALAAAASALGIASIRAPLQALRLAHAHAACGNRAAVAAADLAAAAALVLGPRATRLPQSAEPPPPAPDLDDDPDDDPDDSPPRPPAEGDNSPEPPRDPPPQSAPDPTDLILEAARTALPPGLLDALAAGTPQKAPGGGRSGAKLRSLTGGRPAGVRAGAPGRGARLALIETIKAAAPWQALRPARQDGRLSFRHDDLRIRRFVARAETTTVFAVDASGSAAFARLAEAKGAVELLLAEAYVKRTEVALVVFRGDSAEVSLPTTRSLARAKRELAALAGGGGTPMAAGIDLARRVAEAERARGRTPLVVVLTDGRANVGGSPGQTPQEAALASARAVATSGLKSVFIDCSARPRPEGGALAAAMGARLVALPRLDAQAVVAAVNAVASAA